MEKKYRNPLIAYIISSVLIIFAGIAMGRNEGFMRYFIDDMGLQIIYIFFAISLASIIGTVAAGYLLAPLFLMAYKYTVGIRMTFGIQDRPEPTKLKVFFKGIFPALLALQIALLFYNLTFLTDLVSSSYSSNSINAPNVPLVILSIILPVTAGFATGIFSPVWFLLDGGIVYTNKFKVEKIRDPIEVKSVGGWYHYIIKGYSGVAVIIGYFSFAGDFIIKNNNPSVFLIAFLPVLVLLFSIPGYLVLELTANHRKKYMRHLAAKLGIDKPLADPLDLQKT
ncbi:MAG: hypothetical protein JW891_17100 [Candidatus Lokiarchaeota archaeon]|nr:hypothetical protein [Candidatus Lokiarchaeota archaeon]